jgi:hypothetical protein
MYCDAVDSLKRCSYDNSLEFDSGLVQVFLVHCISVVPEPESSSPYLQQQVTGPYPEPTEFTLHPRANLPKIHSDPILPSTPPSSEWSLSFGLSHQNPVHMSLLSHTRHTPRPPHSL